MDSISIASEKTREYGCEVETNVVDVRAKNTLTAIKLEGIADDGVNAYRRLRNAEPSTFEQSKSLYEQYIAWHECTTEVLRAIDAVESAPQAAKVFAAEDLRSDFQEVSSFLDRIKGRLASLDQFIAGKGIPAERFVDGL